MNNYVSFLRGINVGGKHKILMKDLQSLYHSLSFIQISTYIQSGNVFFSSDLEKSDIKHVIEEGIHSKYGFEVPIIVKRDEEISNIVDKNPFLTPIIDTKRLYVTFLENQPSEDKIQNLRNFSFDKDEIAILDDMQNIVYLNFDSFFGKSKLDNNYLEKILETKATTRNWNTVLKTKERLIKRN